MIANYDKKVLTAVSKEKPSFFPLKQKLQSAALSCGTFYSDVQSGSVTFKSVDETLVCDHSNESY